MHDAVREEYLRRYTYIKYRSKKVGYGTDDVYFWEQPACFGEVA